MPLLFWLTCIIFFSKKKREVDTLEVLCTMHLWFIRKLAYINV